MWAAQRVGQLRGCADDASISHNAVSGPRVKLDAYDAGTGGALFGNGSAGANCMAGVHRPLRIGNPNA